MKEAARDEQRKIKVSPRRYRFPNFCQVKKHFTIKEHGKKKKERDLYLYYYYTNKWATNAEENIFLFHKLLFCSQEANILLLPSAVSCKRVAC